MSKRMQNRRWYVAHKWKYNRKRHDAISIFLFFFVCNFRAVVIKWDVWHFENMVINIYSSWLCIKYIFMLNTLFIESIGVVVVFMYGVNSIHNMMFAFYIWVYACIYAREYNVYSSLFLFRERDSLYLYLYISILFYPSRLYAELYSARLQNVYIKNMKWCRVEKLEPILLKREGRRFSYIPYGKEINDQMKTT